jgi:SOS response regulatory protein OraA/RecX
VGLRPDFAAAGGLALSGFADAPASRVVLRFCYAAKRVTIRAIMPSKRLLENDADLYAAALRALMRRPHSVYEMRVLLERRAAEKSLVPAVMEKLKHFGYLDDARYASEFARAHARIRRQGKFRIARELRTRGVPDRHIEAALESVFAETDERAILRARVERRVRLIRGEMDERKRASLYGSLLRAGFPADAIRDELRRLRVPAPREADDAPVPDTEDDSA